MSSKRTDARSWNLLKHRGLALETPKSGAEDYPGNHADYGSASTAVPFEAARLLGASTTKTRMAVTASALRERSVAVPVAASNNVADHHV